MFWVRSAMVVLSLTVLAEPVWGQRTDFTPPELEGIEIQDNSGDMVSGDLKFLNEDGDQVVLGDYLNQDKPLIIQLVYFDCPMLCNLVINGFVDGAADLEWKPGQDYTVLSVSFDPKDTPELAKQKKINYVKGLAVPGAGDGWHFLTGAEDQVGALASSLGFPYRYMKGTGEFSHGAGIFVLTPSGKISRTLYGIEFPTQALKFSLMEASKGRLGSALDKIVLYCFRYDADSHRYSFVAVNAMKIGGAITVLGLGTLLAVLWSREHRRAQVA